MKKVKKVLAVSTVLVAAMGLCACEDGAPAELGYTETESADSISTEAASEEQSSVAVEDTDAEENADTDVSAEADSNADLGADSDENEELFKAFIDDEIPAIRKSEDGTEDTFMYSDLPHDPEEWDNVTVSDERVDLDNDGENELILTGANGGMYLDARDGKVYVLAEGDGTAFRLGHAEYEGSTYVVHSDTTHGGRQAYTLDKYNGKGEIEDSFQLAAMYWDNEYDLYDHDSEFIFRDKNITMEEYEALAKEILDVPTKLEWAEKVAENDINYPDTREEPVKNDGTEAFTMLIDEFAGEYTYVKDQNGLGGTLSIRLNELGYDINDNNSNGYRFLANDSNVEYIQGNRMMIAYPGMVYSDGDATFNYYVIVKHNGYLSVFEADSKYENLQYLYTAWVKY